MPANSTIPIASTEKHASSQAPIPAWDSPLLWKWQGGAHMSSWRAEADIPEAGEKVKKKSGSKKVEMRYLDLSKIETIHSFVDGLVRDGIRPDVTMLNAGVALPKARKTASGQDEMFLVNYLSNVILTNLMISKGVIPFRYGKPKPRILFISSDSHQGASAIDYDEFGVFFDHGVSKGIENYSYFKLVLNTYATELSRRVNRDIVQVGINVICPGPVHSRIIKEAPLPLRLILGAIFRIIFRSPSKAAMPVVYMAISNDYEGKSNEYLHMFNPKLMDPKVYLPDEGIKLWKESYRVWQEIDPLCCAPHPFLLTSAG